MSSDPIIPTKVPIDIASQLIARPLLRSSGERGAVEGIVVALVDDELARAGLEDVRWILTAGGIIAPVIPPSIGMIVLSNVAGVD